MYFEKLLSFLQGASWALALGGGSYTFLFFLPFGLIVSAIIGLFFFIAGMFFVMIFEIALMQRAKLQEAQKQTLLLEQLIHQNDDKILSNH